MLSRTRVRTRLFALVILLTGLAGGVSAIAIAGGISSLHAVDRLSNRTVPALRLVSVADINLQDTGTELRLAVSAHRLSERNHYRAEAVADVERVDAAVHESLPLLSPAGLRRIAGFPAHWRRWRAAVLRQADQLKARPRSSSLALTSSTRSLSAFHQADLALWDTVNTETAATARQRGAAQSAMHQVILLVACGGLATVIVGILLVFWLSRAITLPLARLATVARRVASGDRTHRSGVAGSGEIGELGLAFDQMSDHLSQLISELENAQTDTIRALVQTLEARDPYTANHSVSVAVYAADIARELGLGEPRAQRLYLAGLVHDLGKTAIDGSILRKPASLTDEEFAEIKRHPVIGEQIILAVPSLLPLAGAVRSHHERLDGNGYPDGLRGDAIPVDAQIVAVADTWNAMTSDRPYRKGMDDEAARTELRRIAGSSLALEIVLAFTRVLARNDTRYGRGHGPTFDRTSSELTAPRQPETLARAA